ncbi:MAG: MATE family efflux transporter [Anaerovoracaceae bacterium]
MKQEIQFTEGKIFQPLFRFALPVLLAMCLQSMYGAVDLLIVGQFGVAADVSAVATGSQMMQMLTILVTGLAAGITILLGQTIGSGKREEAGYIIGTAICFFLLLALAITGIMIFATEPFATVMRAPKEAFASTVQYVKICSGGMVFIAAYNVLGSIFRGIGDSRTPLMTVIFACVFNIAGDLFFVAVLGMAAEGAAIATVLAQALSVILCFFMIRKRGFAIPFSRKHVRIHGKNLGRMLKISFPIALQDGLVNISFLAIGAIVNSLGVIPSAGVGVAERICGFIMLVPSAFSQSLSAFVAQNIGAGKPVRARRAMVCGMGMSLAAGIVMAWMSFFHGDLLSAIFASQEEVILASADYLKAYAIDTLIVSFLFCYIGYFNGCGKTTLVMVQGIIGAFGVRIPVSWFMSRLQPVSLFHIGLATPCSTVVQIIICTAYFLWLLRQEKSKTENGEKDKVPQGLPW